MKKLLLLALLLLLSNFGQAQTTGPGFVIYVGSAPSGTCSAGAYQEDVIGLGTVYTCQSGTWTQVSGGGGGGGVTSVATASPITGGTITTTGTIACATCVKATSPGAGIAHFAGSTQEVTSSLIVAADITSATITGTQIASSVALAGSPTTTTQSANDNSTKVATTAYVDGKSSSGPVLDYTQCFNDDTGGGGLSSLACSSTINVSVGDILLSFCSFATNDGGTVTLAMSSSPAETWATDITFYSSNSTDRSSVFRTTATSSGAYTFTCTPSSSKPFPTLTVVKVTGITGLDTSGSRGTTSSTTHIGSTLTTTVGSDLVLMFTGAVGGNEGNCTSIWVGGFNLQARTDIAMYLGAKKLGAAGTYTFTAIGCSNNAYGTVSVAYK